MIKPITQEICVIYGYTMLGNSPKAVWLNVTTCLSAFQVNGEMDINPF